MAIGDIQTDSIELDKDSSKISDKLLSDDASAGDSSDDGAADSSSDSETSDDASSDASSDGATTGLDDSSASSESLATDLQLDNDADKENVKVGELVTWILEAKNLGPNDAENVQVYDELPEGMEYVSHTVTKGDFDPETGIWKVGDLKVGETAILKIVTKALTLGEKVNKANLTSDTEIIDPDECYEEEEIDVEDDDDDDDHDHFEKKIHSKQLPRVGNPILLLLLSLMTVLGFSIKKEN